MLCTDDSGFNSVVFRDSSQQTMNATKPIRVVTLIPSATEIVCALGCQHWLVGRSHECDYPLQVDALPSLTKAKFPLTESSSGIDRYVKDIIADNLSVYDIDKKALKVCSPDIIITQDQCDVCAVSLRDVEEAVCEWTDHQATIISLKPDTLDDVYKDITKVAEALEVATAGERLIADMRARMAVVRNKTSAVTNRPRVACIEWIDPLMSAGNWMPELVEMAGGQNLFGETGKHSPRLSFDDLIKSDPEVIIILPCGYEIDRSLMDMPLLEKLPGWSEINAVREGCVFVADGNHYFNRPGPRLAESLEILAELIHPEYFEAHYQGSGWESYPPIP